MACTSGAEEDGKTQGNGKSQRRQAHVDTHKEREPLTKISMVREPLRAMKDTASIKSSGT